MCQSGCRLQSCAPSNVARRPRASLRSGRPYPRCAESVPGRAATVAIAMDVWTRTRRLSWTYVHPCNDLELQGIQCGEIYTPAVGGSIPSAPTSATAARTRAPDFSQTAWVPTFRPHRPGCRIRPRRLSRCRCSSRRGGPPQSEFGARAASSRPSNRGRSAGVEPADWTRP